MQYNKDQQKIIDSISGAYLVSAPVGTGKTMVLAERVVQAIAVGIKPTEILCLTFTNRAAEEMRQRIGAKLPKEKFDEILISTFHGFCAYFIKAESKALGINRDFVIFDEDEQLRLAKLVLANHPKFSAIFSQNRTISNFLEEFYKYRLNILERQIGCDVPTVAMDEDLIAIGHEYLKSLNEQNALDFKELVLLVLTALYQDQALLAKWSQRFKLVQLDEFQDTHLSEYLVIKQLARIHKNIIFIGDMDQSIYAWRGSQPQLIVDLLRNHFAPVTELALTINYRSPESLISAIKDVLKNLQTAHTKEITSSQLSDFNCVNLFNGYNLAEEVDYAIDRINQIKTADPKASTAVLVRTNYLISDIANIFQAKNIPHVTVDQYDFFKRQEIKDVLAYLKIIFNKFDLESAHRLLERPARQIGEETLKTIRQIGLPAQAGAPSGLRLSDFLQLSNYSSPEPFDILIQTWQQGRLIVLDTETTGTNPARDEIIQIYAREVVNGQVGESLHYYLKNSLPVGASFAVHKLSDEFLAKEGRDPKTVLRELQEFIGSAPVIGHNVNFDLAMILANGARQKINFAFPCYFDTLDMSRRLIDSENYKLTTLAKLLDLASATHSADDDVMATIGLLGVLVDKLRPGAAARQTLFKKYAKRFYVLANSIAQWEKAVLTKRPNVLLEQVWQESGLAEYYQDDQEADKRQQSFGILKKLFSERDNLLHEPKTALLELLNFSSLAKNVDWLGLDQGQTPIINIHQAKGLEFDYVFLLGLNEGKFPGYKNDNLEEEKRLFYVALTRAKKEIFLTYSNFDAYNRSQAKSRFIDYLDNKYIKQ